MLRIGGNGVSPDRVLCQGAVTAGPGLQGDGVDAEVFQNVKDGVEPHVLNPTLTVRIDRHPDVLGSALEVEGEDIFSSSGLALSDEEDSVACDGLMKNHGGRVSS